MYKNTVQTGEEKVSPLEEMLQSLQVRVLVSHRLTLQRWSFDLFSPFWRLYANDRSGAFLRAADRTYELRPDRIYLVPAWVVFETGLRSEVTHDFMHFNLGGFPVSLHHRLFDKPIELPAEPLLDALRRRWGQSLSHGTPQDWADFGWASALANAAVSTAACGLDAGDRDACLHWLSHAKEVRPALIEIDHTMANPPGNDRLAALCHLSTNQFVRVFQRAVGLTPARYGLERRLAVAADALVGSLPSIDAVADATGFSDRFHFSRAFKARFGLTPVAYRRMHKNAA